MCIFDDIISFHALFFFPAPFPSAALTCVLLPQPESSLPSAVLVFCSDINLLGANRNVDPL